MNNDLYPVPPNYPYNNLSSSSSESESPTLPQEYERTDSPVEYARPESPTSEPEEEESYEEESSVAEPYSRLDADYLEQQRESTRQQRLDRVLQALENMAVDSAIRGESYITINLSNYNVNDLHDDIEEFMRQRNLYSEWQDESTLYFELAGYDSEEDNQDEQPDQQSDEYSDEYSSEDQPGPSLCSYLIIGAVAFIGYQMRIALLNSTMPDLTPLTDLFNSTL